LIFLLNLSRFYKNYKMPLIPILIILSFTAIILAEDPTIEVDIHSKFVDDKFESAGATVSSPFIPGASVIYEKPRHEGGQFMLNYQFNF